jgi:hypothetical protein
MVYNSVLTRQAGGGHAIEPARSPLLSITKGTLRPSYHIARFKKAELSHEGKAEVISRHFGDTWKRSCHASSTCRWQAGCSTSRRHQS